MANPWHRCLFLVQACVATLAGCASPLVVRQDVLDTTLGRQVACLAVLPFRNLTSTVHAGDVVAEELASSMVVSERFNIVAPLGADYLLQQLSKHPPQAVGAADAAYYGALLGVDAVLVGSVTEFRSSNGNGAPNEPVIGFTTQLVHTSSGRVIWSATASNFDHQVLLALPKSHQDLMREAVDATLEDLTDIRDDQVADRRLCAGVYAQLANPPQRAAAAQVTKPPEPAPTPEPSTQPPAPKAEPEAKDDVPPLPDLSNEAVPSLPPLPDVQQQAPPDNNSPPAAAPGAPPQAVRRSLSKIARGLALRLYRGKPARLAAAFPQYADGELALSPKARKLLDSLAELLTAVPTMVVRLEIAAPFGKPTVPGVELAASQAAVMRAYLHGGLRVPEERVVVKTTTPKASGAARKKDNVITVSVLRY